MCAQNVELSESKQYRVETLKRLGTIKQTNKKDIKYSTKYFTYPFTVFLSFTSLQKNPNTYIIIYVYLNFEMSFKKNTKVHV